MAGFIWFRPQTWKALWIALRRAHRDSHARKILLRLLFSLIFFAAWIGFNYFEFRGMTLESGRVGDTIYLVVFTGILFIVGGSALYYKFDARKQERRSPSVAKEVKLALYREACLLATLLERLASEHGMETILPPTIEVITRRVLLDRLQTLGLREGIEPWLLDLLLAPDGHWTTDQKERAIPAWEFFAVLWWVLGKGELRGLAENPKYSLSDARALFDTKRPAHLHVLPSWDLRPARNNANSFLHRCYSELVARGAISSASEEDVEKALEIRAQIQEEGYLGDFLVGVRTVPELETAHLFFVFRRAYHRWLALCMLVEVLSGDAPITDIRKHFARYFAPAEVEDEGSGD